MQILRKLLLPFSLIYLLITAVRNYFYNTGVFKAVSFDIPVIAIGNLSTGGTGKSPQAEYLIRLLKDNFRVATLSRGYKRKSKGYILADENSNAEILGDEPYQFHHKFPDINVAVDANRKNGIENLLQLKPRPEVIILDDAYQHRKVKAGFYVLLTAYGDIYADDFLLPAGNLRESRSGAKRANIIIVTKCPAGISEIEQAAIVKKLKPQPGQKVYFTSIKYDNYIYNSIDAIPVDEVKKQEKVLVSGIAKPQPFYNYLQQPNDVLLSYPDHHNFSEKDVTDIKAAANGKLIITTEKDYVRLKDKMIPNLYYLPIKTDFLKGAEDFNEAILEFIKKA